jgi:hypothetical protein
MKIPNYTNWDDFKKELLKSPEFKRLYEESRPEFEKTRALIRARIERKTRVKHSI